MELSDIDHCSQVAVPLLNAAVDTVVVGTTAVLVTTAGVAFVANTIAACCRGLLVVAGSAAPLIVAVAVAVAVATSMVVVVVASNHF